MNSLARMDTGLVIRKWSNSLVESLSTSRLVVKALVRRYILFNDSKRWSVLVAQRIPSTLVELESHLAVQLSSVDCCWKSRFSS